MGDGMLALTWNNHSTTFFKTLSTVRLKERYTDVTLSCEGRFYQLHKLVLSTCSDYFEKIFEQTPCKHPVIVLRDVSCDELEALLNYMYLGSVSVAQNDLSRLIKVAELFQIKGLAVPDEPPKPDNNSYSSKKNDSRDRSSNYRNSQPESSRTRPCASDSSDTPVPKRARTSESYSSSASLISERSRLDDRVRSQGTIGDSSGREGSGVGSSSSVQDAPSFEFKIKEEVVHDIRDSDSEDPNSSGAFDALNDPDTGGSFDPLHDDSQNDNMIIVPKPEPEDIPPDESSVTQPGLDQESYSDDLGIPGPSDAQGWYSEGDGSSGLPGAKGSIGDESQDMHSLLASQQQPQQQGQSQQQMIKREFIAEEAFAPGDPMIKQEIFLKQEVEEEEKEVSVTMEEASSLHIPIFQCTECPYFSRRKTHLKKHLLVHTKEKPHLCPHCPAAFSQRCNLKTHIRTHTGEKPFACTHCSYRATHKRSLKIHMENRHNIPI